MCSCVCVCGSCVCLYVCACGYAVCVCEVCELYVRESLPVAHLEVQKAADPLVRSVLWGKWDNIPLCVVLELFWGGGAQPCGGSPGVGRRFPPLSVCEIVGRVLLRCERQAQGFYLTANFWLVPSSTYKKNYQRFCGRGPSSDPARPAPCPGALVFVVCVCVVLCVCL